MSRYFEDLELRLQSNHDERRSFLDRLANFEKLQNEFQQLTKKNSDLEYQFQEISRKYEILQVWRNFSTLSTKRTKFLFRLNRFEFTNDVGWMTKTFRIVSVVVIRSASRNGNIIVDLVEEYFVILVHRKRRSFLVRRKSNVSAMTVTETWAFSRSSPTFKQFLFCFSFLSFLFKINSTRKKLNDFNRFQFSPRTSIQTVSIYENRHQHELWISKIISLMVIKLNWMFKCNENKSNGYFARC